MSFPLRSVADDCVRASPATVYISEVQPFVTQRASSMSLSKLSFLPIGAFTLALFVLSLYLFAPPFVVLSPAEASVQLA